MLMVKVTSKLAYPLNLPTGHVIPAKGKLLVTERTWRRILGDCPSLQAQIRLDQVAVDYVDDQPAQEAPETAAAETVPETKKRRRKKNDSDEAEE